MNQLLSRKYIDYRKKNDLDWPEVELADEVVEIVQEPSAEEIEKEIKSSLDKEFKHALKNQQELNIDIEWKEEFSQVSMPDDRVDRLDYSLKVEMVKFLRKIIKPVST